MMAVECVYCGQKVNKTDWEGICKSCKNVNDENQEGSEDEDYFTCDFCGRREHIDYQYITEDGQYGCERCTSYCDMCEQNYHRDDVTSCKQCGESACMNCINSEGLCDRCAKENKAKEEKKDERNSDK